MTRNLPKHQAQQLFSTVTVSKDSTKKVPAALDIRQNLPSAQVAAPHMLLLRGACLPLLPPSGTLTPEGNATNSLCRTEPEGNTCETVHGEIWLSVPSSSNAPEGTELL